MVEARPEAPGTTGSADDDEKKRKVNSLQEALVRSKGVNAEKTEKLY